MLACCIGLIGLTFCTSQPYKIEITFTVEVEPNTAEDIELIKAPFENFDQLAQSLAGDFENILRQLPHSLASNLAEIPNICEKQRMKGHVDCSVSFTD